jgi:hypothetical protein
MDKLIEIGFEKAGHTNFANGKFEIKIDRYEQAKNILYAFVNVTDNEQIDWQVVYIGHTRNSLKNRMNGYRLGHGKETNNRVHNHLKSTSMNGGKHFIYVLHDKFNLNIHSLAVDLSAGLEYSLIKFYANYNSINGHVELFNIAGNIKNPKAEDTKAILSELHDELADYSNVESPDNTALGTFEYILDKTYWNKPYLNIPSKFTECFGEHGDIVLVEIFMTNNLVHKLEVLVNRKAVANGTPRLYFPAPNSGNLYQEWKQKNFREGDILTVTIIQKNHISISSLH